MMNMDSSKNDYLGVVEFEGWDYRKPVPSGIKNRRFLEDANPWLRFLCILERAKDGDFSQGDRLAGICISDDYDLRFAAQYLLASIGTEDHLQVLKDAILKEGGWRMEAADHAAISGSLTFVETFIAGYRIAFGETTRAAMEDGLSNLLVCDPESRFVADCLVSQDQQLGVARLHEAAMGKNAAFGPGVSLYRGHPLRVDAVVKDAVRILEEESSEFFAALQSQLTRLQTMLGFSQAGMFRESEDGVSHEWDEPLIRRTLDEATRVEFESGTRYFFGHRAPLI